MLYERVPRSTGSLSCVRPSGDPFDAAAAFADVISPVLGMDCLTAHHKQNQARLFVLSKIIYPVRHGIPFAFSST